MSSPSPYAQRTGTWRTSAGHISQWPLRAVELIKCDKLLEARGWPEGCWLGVHHYYCPIFPLALSLATSKLSQWQAGVEEKCVQAVFEATGVNELKSWDVIWCASSVLNGRGYLFVTLKRGRYDSGKRLPFISNINWGLKMTLVTKRNCQALLTVMDAWNATTSLRFACRLSRR